MCMPPHRVASLGPFGLKTGTHFAHFSLESGMVFEGTTGVYERIYLKKKREICKFEMDLKSFFVCTLIKLQFGFLKGKSTTAQLLQVLHNISEKLDKRVQVDFDFAKAFDRVNHKLLLKKIHRFGICGTLLSWFEDYLTVRAQRVTVLGVNSKSLPVISGVPQGSTLGPLLFLVYVTWRPQHLLLSLLTTRSATGQSKAWRMVPAYSATSTTLTNGVISGKWI